MAWILEHKPAREEWSKTFETKELAVAELRAHICSDCMKGDILICDSGTDGGLRREHLCNAPDPNSAYDLLSTPCGCEYDLNEEATA